MTAALPITVLVQTKNEEIGLGACIDALRDFDQVIVVDSHSTDRTVEIAREHGAEVVEFVWNGEYPKKKQWMLENAPARHDWCLVLDADERPTPELVAELRRRIPEMERGEFAAYEIELAYVFNGRTLRHGHMVVKRSLLDRKRVRFVPVDDIGAPGIGEVEGHYQPKVDGATGRLDAKLLHDDRDPIRTWFDRHNKYSDWEAYLAVRPEARAQVDALRSSQGQKFAKVPFKPLAFFVYDYVVKRGFLDGRAGFNYAVALSWYYWLTEVKIREAREQR